MTFILYLLIVLKKKTFQSLGNTVLQDFVNCETLITLDNAYLMFILKVIKQTFFL